jgi:GAF domain-containing protein
LSTISPYISGSFGRDNVAAARRAEAKAMANLKEPLDAATGQQIDVVLQRLRSSKDVGADLLQVLDIAIGITGADMGMLQRFDERADCLTIVASRGFSTEALTFFGVVRRDTNTTCAAALMRRMRVFVEDVATSYLFVGTRELDVLRAGGTAAVQSTPLISSNGHLWGVVTTHFREPQIESEFDHAPLDRLAVQVADGLEQREGLVPSQHFNGKQVPEDSQPGG